MDITKLTQIADHRQLNHERPARELLGYLRKIDPGIAERIVEVFGDETLASRWLVSPVRSLRSLTPLQALAESRRGDVLTVLNQIFHGIYA